MTPKAKTVVRSLLVSRPSENLHALVVARLRPDVEQIQPALTAALTEWRDTTEAGAEAWADSSEDFNVGDLTGYVENRALRRLLRARGILRLTIEIFHSDDRDDEWHYDTILMDPPDGKDPL